MKFSMARQYKLGRRGEQQAETRQRIVEATVELHSTVGPARTTVSDIAEKAGVQRHTVYAHFPDETTLFQACSGLTEERDPFPVAEPWRSIADKRAQLTTALNELYAWFNRNAQLMTNVLRDRQTHEVTRRTADGVFGAPRVAQRDVLGVGLDKRQRVLLALALNFHTWHTLTAEAGLSHKAAVETMVETVLGS
jgi:AcrR family transcriptional regulator